MPDLLHELAPGTPVFVTVQCHECQPCLADPAHKALLLGVMREMKATIPFQMIAYAILDDHFHWLIGPNQADDVPLLVQSVKLRFTRRFRPPADAGPDYNVWEKRYRDHVAVGETESGRLLDCVHYDPVKHGLVADPKEYPWSSFRSYLAKGSYPERWGVDAPPAGIEGAKAL